MKSVAAQYSLSSMKDYEVVAPISESTPIGHCSAREKMQRCSGYWQGPN
jgi:hypothetical protein